MKQVLLLLFVFCWMMTLSAASLSDSRMQLVWSDEFDVDGLPDSRIWGYEEGFVRNHESQYYTKARLENARVKDGHLIIEARKESYPNPQYKEGSANGMQNRKSADYTSAAVISHGKKSWQYGRLEVRAKLPRGKGMWPAIWMMGEDISKVGWPKCGEIDVMEFVAKEPGNIYATVHFPIRKKTPGKMHESKGGMIKDLTVSDTFHIYAFEWTPERMDFFLDDRKYHSVEMKKIAPNEPFHKPYYLLLNLAVGGSWGGAIDNSIFPQQFMIDYVRVYQDKK